MSWFQDKKVTHPDFVEVTKLVYKQLKLNLKKWRDYIFGTGGKSL